MEDSEKLKEIEEAFLKKLDDNLEEVKKTYQLLFDYFEKPNSEYVKNVFIEISPSMSVKYFNFQKKTYGLIKNEFSNKGKEISEGKLVAMIKSAVNYGKSIVTEIGNDIIDGKYK